MKAHYNSGFGESKSSIASSLEFFHLIGFDAKAMQMSVGERNLKVEEILKKFF
jgi:hypothetical protein